MRKFMISTVAAGVVAVAGLGATSSQAATYNVDITSDFFTTAWAFGAPYVRDADRDQLGVSGTNPYGMGEYVWEEVSYFVFDIQGAGIQGVVDSALLNLTTAARTGTSNEEVIVSLHRLTADPLSIDPSKSAGSGDPNSYYAFSTTAIDAVIDEQTVSGVGQVVSFDLTDLVNEWLASGDANYPYAIALTGRNASNDAGAWTAFVNSGYPGGGVFTVTTADVAAVPTPASAALIAAGMALIAARRRRTELD